MSGLNPDQNANGDKGRKRKKSISDRRNFAKTIDTKLVNGNGSQSDDVIFPQDNQRNDEPMQAIIQNGVSPAVDPEMVEEQAPQVIMSAFSEMYARDVRHRTGEDSPATPGFEEGVFDIQEFTTQTQAHPLDIATRTGRILGELGDDFDRRYQPVLDDLAQRALQEVMKDGTRKLQTAYAMFKQIAKRTAQENSLGRIVSIVCFGYRFAVALVRNGVHGFVSKVVDLVVKYLIEFGITRYIANIGGWAAVITLATQGIVLSSQALVRSVYTNPWIISLVFIGSILLARYLKK